MKKINRFRDEHFFLSNFSESRIELVNGMVFDNLEAAFQSFKNLDRQAEFQTMSPRKAKRVGREVKLRSDWEEKKLGIMGYLVGLKFRQNESLRKLLLETDGSYLEEGNDWKDDFWGTVNGFGKNHLGKILMTVREELK